MLIALVYMTLIMVDQDALHYIRELLLAEIIK